MKYVNVVIDNKSNSTDYYYTYSSFFDQVELGQKVLVPFGRSNTLKEAYIFQILENTESKIKNIKEIIEIKIDGSISQEAVEICIWMREHYFCRYIDAVKCFTMPGKPNKKVSVFESAKDEDDFIGEAELTLTEEQDTAKGILFPAINAKVNRTFLIHGVTSSGKTEIYIRAIKETLSLGKTAIMLVPEISLTSQIIERFEKRFGMEKIAVLHSKLSRAQRQREWDRIKNKEASIVIGARSGIFAPLENIGIIVIDEEHDGSYKSDMTPKYDTIEVAAMRAYFNDAIFLLGSATPSINSYYNCMESRAQLIKLNERFNKTSLPDVTLVDMREELKNGNRSIFSRELYSEIENNLAIGKQVILFLNRRGYSTFITCRGCGYTMKCKDCGVALTYHKGTDVAVCHYCGYKEKVQNICPNCNQKYLKHFGTGTEKVEELARELFPTAGIERLDLDAVKKISDMDKILCDFRKGKVQILIGTQIVAKGLDFSNVGLVGIIAADISLNIPDYRSAERSFQLITQAAGRAGRGSEIGKVVVQSYFPEHYAIMTAINHDYQGFYKDEIFIRKNLNYPPFNQIILITISSKQEEIAQAAAESIYKIIKIKAGENEGKNVLPATQSVIFKSKEYYRYQIIIKASNEKMESYRKLLWKIKMRNTENNKSDVLISIDVNPYSFY
ncbi:MAG: primosomal protein N' [Eubacteriales bacterium]